MKKKIICIGIISIFLLTCLLTLSVIGTNIETSENNQETSTTLVTGRIYGYVYYFAGGAVKGATVVHWDTGGGGFNSYVTGDNGKYEFDVELNHMHKIGCTKEGYRTSPFGGYEKRVTEAHPTAGPLDFTLTKKIKSQQIPTNIQFMNLPFFRLIERLLFVRNVLI